MTKKYRYEIPTTIFFLTAAAVLLLDQLTKILIRQNIPTGVSVPIIPKILFLSHTTNTGASFSLLTTYSFLLTSVAIAVILGIILLYKKIPNEYKLSFALILGGTAGNLIDRLWFGTVTDFVDFRIWPIFNVADSAITLAAILLIIAVFREEKEIYTKS
ncbi:signal peptidase II [Candidatus Woesearchaeota archaeon]|nr:signal peptidase II [Candidatus Woesearchaeota archaeon]